MDLEDEGMRLLQLYREQRQYTYPTLDGRKVNPYYYDRTMFKLYEDKIYELARAIGGKAKTKIRKECKERGIHPRIECSSRKP